jgi:hypothetical protein
MKRNRSSYAFAALLSITVTGSALLAPAHTALAAPSTFIKTYSSIDNTVQGDDTPSAVAATSDGGSILLALTETSTGVEVDWLVKLDPLGTPQWEKYLGCPNLPPGSYTYGVSVKQTTDGGYIVGGGTIGCGSGSTCPFLDGYQCAFAEKLDQNGNRVWAYAYQAGAEGGGFTQIRQTSDGGYIAVGNTITDNPNTGGLIMKLSSQGSVQWQREIGPTASTLAYFNAVALTSDGGYVAVGDFYTLSGSIPPTSVLAVKVNASGTVQWQKGFNTVDSSGAPTAVTNALSAVGTANGGVLIAGNWVNMAPAATCCRGGLLLKLDANGNLLGQKVYTGGLYCFEGTCNAIGGVIYSVQPTADGGYALAGDEDFVSEGLVQLVPWMGKVDANGNLLWQHDYFQVYAPTGRPLSEYFASSIVTPDGGVLALGYTENYALQKGELYGVKTDGQGLVGACSNVYTAPPITVENPGMRFVVPALPVHTTITPGATSPSTTSSTGIGVSQEC